MPFYRIYYPAGALTKEAKIGISSGFTEAHSTIAGAPPYGIKVAFVSLSEDDFYSGGQPETALIRVVGLLKGGRDLGTRRKLLAALDKIIQPYAVNFAIETTLIENREEDTVRHAGENTASHVKHWAAIAPP